MSLPIKYTSILINVKKVLKTPLGYALKRTQSEAEAQAKHDIRKVRKILLEETKQEIEQMGYQPGKSYPHPQAWRVVKFGGAFANLGSTATLPAHLFYELNITDWFWNMAMSANFKSSVGVFRVHDLLVLWNRIVYRPFFNYMKYQIGTPNSINGQVPSDSGTLRETILGSLTDTGSYGGTNTKGFPILITMDAGDLDYARPVNKMPSKNLKHMGVKRNGRFLFDPSAKQDFWGTLQMDGKKRLKSLHTEFLKEVAKLKYVQDLADFMKMTLSKRLSPYNVAQKMFEVRGLR